MYYLTEPGDGPVLYIARDKHDLTHSSRIYSVFSFFCYCTRFAAIVGVVVFGRDHYLLCITTFTNFIFYNIVKFIC